MGGRKETEKDIKKQIRKENTAFHCGKYPASYYVAFKAQKLTQDTQLHLHIKAQASLCAERTVNGYVRFMKHIMS